MSKTNVTKVQESAGQQELKDVRGPIAVSVNGVQMELRVVKNRHGGHNVYLCPPWALKARDGVRLLGAWSGSVESALSHVNLVNAEHGKPKIDLGVPLKAGDRFTHRRVLDGERRPMICRVTAVRQGYVYWRPESDPNAKTKDCFAVEHADRFVLKVLA